LLWQESSGRFASEIIVLLLNLDELCAQLRAQFAFSLELIDLLELFGECFALRNESRA
jgi:hypothetical protein